MSIPVLDLNCLSRAPLDSACHTWGFFALTGHGIDTALQREAFAQIHRFFAQPLDVKNQIRRTAGNCWGFYDAELTKNRRDWKEILDIGAPAESGPLAGAQPQWPGLPGFQATLSTLEGELHRVALAVVEAIITALGADIDLHPVFDQHTSFLRINHYPPCPEPAEGDTLLQAEQGHLGISHHTDAGAVTVLLQDEHPGLQVFQNNRWHTVAPQPEALIINIGDVVQVWSNDHYRAPLHRVLANRTARRFSIPYFLNPDYNFNYAPIGNHAGSPRYRPINWGEFRARRSAGDYADQGAEVQISDYLNAGR